MSPGPDTPGAPAASGSPPGRNTSAGGGPRAPGGPERAERAGRSRRGPEWWLTAPSFGWLCVFFAVPALLVLAVSFRVAGPYGGIEAGWSLDAWRALGDPSYPAIAWRTLWMSLVATLVCLAAGIPAAFAIARAPTRWRAPLLLLVVVPFWTNFLIRVYAWKVLLHPEGLLQRTLVAVGLAGEGAVLLYQEGSVLLVMVYAYLPFAILPLYAAAEKFDHSLLDAARDLGASAAGAFWRVFVPGVSRGIGVAAVMVLVPSLGAYVIPDLVGGEGAQMLGTKIAQRVFVDRNWPQAAALASVLMLATLPPLLFVYRSASRRRAEADGGRKGGLAAR